MKNFLLKMFLMTSILCFVSCSNEDVYIPQEVEFTLDYTFVESGAMTRASGADAYGNFYEKYIKTKQLTPTTYSLTFKDKETNAIVAEIKGCWKNKDAIRLMEGEYEVTGTSAPKSSYGYVSDTVFLSFQETVHITKDMTNLNLIAKYDSYLLMIDKTNYNEANCTYTTPGKNQNHELYQTDTNFIIFINSLYYSSSNYLKLTKFDGFETKIYLDDIPFEKGKYYYFNDMTNSFDIPKMEPGN